MLCGLANDVRIDCGWKGMSEYDCYAAGSYYPKAWISFWDKVADLGLKSSKSLKECCWSPGNPNAPSCYFNHFGNVLIRDVCLIDTLRRGYNAAINSQK